jgi:hypothetical protein
MSPKRKPKLLAPFDTVVHPVITKMPRAGIHTNIWSWACGFCGFEGNPKFDTLLNFGSHDCDKCGATNSVPDFNAELDRLEALEKEGKL